MNAPRIPAEDLRAISAQRQDGEFVAEKDEGYKTLVTAPHIIRFKPHAKKRDDGTTIVSLSFPALVASDWISSPGDALPQLAAHLNAAPLLAAEVLHLREELRAALAYFQNAKIDLERARAPLSAITTISGAIYRVTEAIGDDA